MAPHRGFLSLWSSLHTSAVPNASTSRAPAHSSRSCDKDSNFHSACLYGQRLELLCLSHLMQEVHKLLPQLRHTVYFPAKDCTYSTGSRSDRSGGDCRGSSPSEELIRIARCLPSKLESCLSIWANTTYAYAPSLLMVPAIERTTPWGPCGIYVHEEARVSTRPLLTELDLKIPHSLAPALQLPSVSSFETVEVTCPASCIPTQNENRRSWATSLGRMTKDTKTRCAQQLHDPVHDLVETRPAKGQRGSFLGVPRVLRGFQNHKKLIKGLQRAAKDQCWATSWEAGMRMFAIISITNKACATPTQPTQTLSSNGLEFLG